MCFLQWTLILIISDFSSSQSCTNGCTISGRYCYLYSRPPLSNNEAFAFCANAGGQLPFFQNETDLADYNTYKISVLGNIPTWLGYWNYENHSDLSPGLWRDKNGTGNPTPFTKFPTGEPNDYGGEESCIQTLSGDVWNDISCNHSSTYTVCMCRCSEISQIANGQTTPSTFPTVNSTTSFTCNQGFKLVGNSRVVCLYNGSRLQWSDNPPVCQRVTCSDWFTRTAGSIQDPPFYGGQSYNYTCNINRIIPNSLTVYGTYDCDTNTGQWVQPQFIPCVATCTNIPSITFGSVTLTGQLVNLSGRVKAGGFANFTCNNGYVLQGNSTVVCGLGGNWSDIAPICKGVFVSDSRDIWWIWPLVVGLITFFCVCCNLLAFLKRKKSKKDKQVIPQNSIETSNSCQSVAKTEAIGREVLRF